MTIKKTLLITLLLALSACTSTPTHVIIAPDMIVKPSNIYLNTQANLVVIDMRTSNHVVQILQAGEAATLVSSQQSLDSIIEKTLSTYWPKQGLELNNSSHNKIEVSIEKAVVSVEQKLMSYKTNSEIVIQVKVTKNKQTLTSSFKSKGNSEGPVQADIAVLERDFNQQFAILLQQILTSKDISTFLINT
ncbi:MAG: YajG family lipoprotein [Colwellia sp.]